MGVGHDTSSMWSSQKLQALVCAAATIASCGIWFGIRQATLPEFVAAGVVAGALGSLPLALLQVAVRRGVYILLARRVSSLSAARLALVPALAVAAVFCVGAYHAADPRTRFCTWVMRPVPQSVQDIHCEGAAGIADASWVFQFRACQSDVEHIAQTLRLKPHGEGGSRSRDQDIVSVWGRSKWHLPETYTVWWRSDDGVERWMFYSREKELAYFVWRSG